MADQAYDDWLAARYPGSGSVSDRVQAGWRRRTLALTAALLLALPLAGYAFVRLGPAIANTEPAPWAIGLGLGSMLLGLAVEIFALVGAFRSGVVSDNRSSRLWALSSRERRHVLAQVRGRRPVAPDELPFVRHIAENVRSQRWLLRMLLGLLLMQLGSAIMDAGPPRVVSFASGVVLAAAGSLLLRDLRLADRFLDRTVETPASTAGRDRRTMAAPADDGS